MARGVAACRNRAASRRTTSARRDFCPYCGVGPGGRMLVGPGKNEGILTVSVAIDEAKPAEKHVPIASAN